MEKLTHLNEDGRPKMVDVGDKDDTLRVGEACGYIYMEKKTLEMITGGKHKKGDVIATAQVAGIMAAKKTWEIIPMCHNILMNGIDMKFEPDTEKNCIYISARSTTRGKTGIEMEVLTAVSVAALTIYDMCKAVDRSMIISDVKLMKKTGGKSGDFNR
jgi:cyclic pyranopterin phosphate synthase